MSESVNQSSSIQTSNFVFFEVALNTQSVLVDVFSTRCAEIQTRAQNAESNIKIDPRIAGFYARNALELMVDTVFDIDKWLTRPRHDATLMSLIHDKDFKQNVDVCSTSWPELYPKLRRWAREFVLVDSAWSLKRVRYPCARISTPPGSNLKRSADGPNFSKRSAEGPHVVSLSRPFQF